MYYEKYGEIFSEMSFKYALLIASKIAKSVNDEDRIKCAG